MSHHEKHIYPKETCFYVELSRGNRVMRRQFTFLVYGGRELAFQAAQDFVASMKALTLQEFYDVRLEPRTRRDWVNPTKPAHMRYIRRVSRQNNNGPMWYAWLVAVPGYRTRSFLFTTWGSEADALAAAMAFRDAPTHDRSLDDLLSARENPGPDSVATSASGPGAGEGSAGGAAPKGD